MFIKKDSRKVVEILLDDGPGGSGGEGRASLSLGRREPEFGGDTAVLLGGEGAATRLAATRSLSLYGNRLHSLSGWEALAGGALRSLDLGHNALTSLPASFGALTGLEALWLEDNALAEFPRPLLRCTALRVLRLSGNALSRLPRGISALAALETLVLSSNELDALPASIGRLRRLATLLVNSNQLRSLPAALARLPALRKLNAANNPLEALPATLLDALGHALPPHVAAAARRVAELRAEGGEADEEGGEEEDRDSGDAGGGSGASAAAPSIDAPPRRVVFSVDETPLAKRAEQLVASEDADGREGKRARVG